MLWSRFARIYYVLAPGGAGSKVWTKMWRQATSPGQVPEPGWPSSHLLWLAWKSKKNITFSMIFAKLAEYNENSMFLQVMSPSFYVYFSMLEARWHEKAIHLQCNFNIFESEVHNLWFYLHVTILSAKKYDMPLAIPYVLECTFKNNPAWF